MEIRTNYHKRLRLIQDDILAMGSMVEKAIINSVEALKNRNLELAQQIIKDDQKVNQKRFEIEDKCTQLIATQQPMAGDLRAIICVLNIITEIERIGDYAEGIARIVIEIGNEPPLKPLIDIPRMAENRLMFQGTRLICPFPFVRALVITDRREGVGPQKGFREILLRVIGREMDEQRHGRGAYQRMRELPHVKPPPKAVNRTRLPRWILLSLTATSRAMGTVAEDILPKCSMVITTLSMETPSFLAMA